MYWEQYNPNQWIQWLFLTPMAIGAWCFIAFFFGYA
jgi:hypothetical protein